MGGGELVFHPDKYNADPFDMTLTCKAKAVIRKLLKSENEELTFELRLRNICSLRSKKFWTWSYLEYNQNCISENCVQK
jgi:hypothetical protein